MKIGDFGRTKRRVYVKRNKCSCGDVCKILFGIVFFLSILGWAYMEWWTSKSMETIRSIKPNLIEVPPNQDGVDQVANNIDIYDETIVHLQGVECTPESIISDRDFNLEFVGKSSVKRGAEYCQWQEYTNTYQTKVGEDDDGNDIVEETTEYYYLKDWRSYQISSFFFDNSIAYNNPSWDPFPAYTDSQGAFIGETQSLYIGKNRLKEKYESYYLPRDLNPSLDALRRGIAKHDYTYVYVSYERSTVGKVVQGLASFFVDGVIDWGLKGRCEAGDVRVYFETAEFHPVQSIIGKVKGSQIYPFAFGSGNSLLLTAEGDLSTDEILNITVKEIRQNLWVSRIICIVSGIIFGLLLVTVKKVKKD